MFKHAADIARIILFSIMLGLCLFACLHCAPQKRLDRLVKNHPELLIKDTLTVRDTIIHQGFKVDTVMSFFEAAHDTVYLTKNNVITKLLLKHDSIYLSTNAKADTIVRHIKVPYKYVQPIAEKWYHTIWFRRIFFLLLLLCGLFFLNKILK